MSESIAKERTAFMSGSVAVLLFHLSGATINGTGVSMVPMQFARTWVIEAGLHIAFLWFAYRFFLVARSSWVQLRAEHSLLLDASLRKSRRLSRDRLKRDALKYLKQNPEALGNDLKIEPDVVVQRWLASFEGHAKIPIDRRSSFPRIAFTSFPDTVPVEGGGSRIFLPVFTINWFTSWSLHFRTVFAGLFRKESYSDLLAPAALGVFAYGTAVVSYAVRWSGSIFSPAT